MALNHQTGKLNKGGLLWCCCLLLLSLLLNLASADQNRDFYKILDIKRNAKTADIKKAYRKLTL